MGKAYNKWENCIQHFGSVTTHLKQMDIWMWTEFIWLRTGISDRLVRWPWVDRHGDACWEFLKLQITLLVNLASECDSRWHCQRSVFWMLQVTCSYTTSFNWVDYNGLHISVVHNMVKNVCVPWNAEMWGRDDAWRFRFNAFPVNIIFPSWVPSVVLFC